jgi:glyoxylase-like metal-dependent hydrolase (beta-lactamase superfamily II)
MRRGPLTPRRVIRAAVLVAACGGCALAAHAAEPPAAPTPGEIAPGVFLFRGAFVPGSQPDGNSVVFTAPQGLVVVDTGRHPAHTGALLGFAAEQKQPVAAILNTHWHLDHIGGNATLRERHPGARLYASGAIVGARSGFLQRYRGQLESMLADASVPAAQKEAYRAEVARIDGSARLEADVTVEAGKEPATVAGRPLELHVTGGATDADVWLFDPRTRVLVAGDLVTLPAPFLDTACAKVWQASLAKLAAVDFATLVPGHGPPLDRSRFDRYRAAFDRLLACAGSQRAADECITGWSADLGDLVPAGEQGFTGEMMSYYMGVLRDPARQSCG